MKAGQLFIITTGEYSDFGIFASLGALKDFSFDDELLAYLETHPEQKVAYKFEQTQFIEHLLAAGFVSQATIPEIHLCDYGTVCRKPELQESGVPMTCEDCGVVGGEYPPYEHEWGGVNMLICGACSNKRLMDMKRARGDRDIA